MEIYQLCHKQGAGLGILERLMDYPGQAAGDGYGLFLTALTNVCNTVVYVGSKTETLPITGITKASAQCTGLCQQNRALRQNVILSPPMNV